MGPVLLMDVLYQHEPISPSLPVFEELGNLFTHLFISLATQIHAHPDSSYKSSDSGG